MMKGRRNEQRKMPMLWMSYIRGDYEICLLCDWEDDNQNDLQAKEVWGGSNEDYSLEEARTNFEKSLIMYRGINEIDSLSTKVKKMKLLKAYGELEASNNMTEKWLGILLLEKELHMSK